MRGELLVASMYRSTPFRSWSIGSSRLMETLANANKRLKPLSIIVWMNTLRIYNDFNFTKSLLANSLTNFNTA